MRNYIQSGATLDVIAPAPVVSGQLVIIGGLVGVATTSAPAGSTFALNRCGLIEAAKPQAEAWIVGAKAYLDGSTGLVTIAAVNAASAPNTLVGRVAEPAGNPSGVGRVLLSDFVGI